MGLARVGQGRMVGKAKGTVALGHVVVKPADTGEDLAVCLGIRREVFVREQGVAPEIEQDGLDAECQHWVAQVAGVPAATARVRTTSAGPKLERVAVLRPWRGKSVGRALVTTVLGSFPEPERCCLFAQSSAKGFWTRLGFCGEGEPFVVAGIDHVRMRYTGSAATRAPRGSVGPGLEKG